MVPLADVTSFTWLLVSPLNEAAPAAQPALLWSSAQTMASSPVDGSMASVGKLLNTELFEAQSGTPFGHIGRIAAEVVVHSPTSMLVNVSPPSVERASTIWSLDTTLAWLPS